MLCRAIGHHNITTVLLLPVPSSTFFILSFSPAASFALPVLLQGGKNMRIFPSACFCVATFRRLFPSLASIFLQPFLYQLHVLCCSGFCGAQPTWQLQSISRGELAPQPPAGAADLRLGHGYCGHGALAGRIHLCHLLQHRCHPTGLQNEDRILQGM
jgi:hypothetical protein